MVAKEYWYYIRQRTGHCTCAPAPSSSENCKNCPPVSRFSITLYLVWKRFQAFWLLSGNRCWFSSVTSFSICFFLIRSVFFSFHLLGPTAAIREIVTPVQLNCATKQFIYRLRMPFLCWLFLDVFTKTSRTSPRRSRDKKLIRGCSTAGAEKRTRTQSLLGARKGLWGGWRVRPSHSPLRLLFVA